MKLKNKKGFTLIELLAVIVVLAIIALIATPIVMNTIKNAKKGAAERTADNYIKQVETSLMEAKLNGNEILDGIYIVDEKGNLQSLVDYDKCRSFPLGVDEFADLSKKYCESQIVTIDMNGTKPSDGTIFIKDNKVILSETELKIDDYKIDYNNNEINKNVICRASTKKDVVSLFNMYNVKMEYQGFGLLKDEVSNQYDEGITYLCNVGDGVEKTFFILEDGDETTLTEGRLAQAGEVSLIMDSNVGSDGKATIFTLEKKETVAGVSKEDFIAAGGEDLSNDGGACQYGGFCSTEEYGMLTANKFLKKYTKTWKNLNQNQISLPTKQQIEKFSNNKKGTFLTTNICAPSVDFQQFFGYWIENKSKSNTGTALYQECFKNFPETTSSNAPTSDSASIGIRPVITISKSQLG